MKIILLMSIAVCFISAFPQGKSTENQQQQQQHKDVQTKRDTSYSYAAADINSKQGTRIKTITVIKNVAGQKDKQIRVNPKYHQNENWGDDIHKNFDKFGKFPGIPDVDELFDFTNNFQKSNDEDTPEPAPVTESSDETKEATTLKSIDENKQDVTSTPPPPSMMEDTIVNNDYRTQSKNISDDVEILDPAILNINNNGQSQSLQNYLTEYSTPNHSVRQYFLTGNSNSTKKSSEYKRLPPYMRPSTFSGSNNNLPSYSPPSSSDQNFSNKPFVPLSNPTESTIPYIAPSILKNSQPQPTGKPLIIPSSSQTPYIAPNIKRINQIQFANNQTNFGNSNQNTFNTDFNSGGIPFRNLRIGSTVPILKNVQRSRGLRY